MFIKRLTSEQIRAEIAKRRGLIAERAARIADLHEKLPGGRGLKLREATRRELTKAELEIEQLEQQMPSALERESKPGLSSGRLATYHRVKRKKGRCICCPRPTSLKPNGEPYAKCDAHRRLKAKREALVQEVERETSFVPVMIRPRR
jgi:hypothetical protein